MKYGRAVGYFNTKAGLKQGCLLSPVFFSMYINDLIEEIGGGVKGGNLNVRALIIVIPKVGV